MNSSVVAHSAPAGLTMRLTGRSQTFPSLHSSSSIAQPDPRHVPKRYEETRAAFVQDFSHRRILSLGFDVHSRLRQQAEFEREEAVRETELKVWREAEVKQQEALDDLRKQLTAQSEQFIQRLKRQHQKALQEKILEVETALHREMVEAVEREKEEGQRRLVAAIEENDRKWQAIVVEEVKAARLEEVRKADAEKAEIRRQHQAEVHALTDRLLAEKAAALQALERRKDSERTAAVADARAEEKSLADSRAALVRERHEAAVSELRAELTVAAGHRAALEEDVARLETARRDLQDSLLAARRRFVDLVHRAFAEDSELGLAEFVEAEDATVAGILTERGVEPAAVRGRAWRPHSPLGPAAVGSVRLPGEQEPERKVRVCPDFL